MKIVSLFLVIVISANCFAQSEDEQPELSRPVANIYVQKIIKDYFRSDPYQNGFASFLKHLMNDPTLTNKAVSKKTDTSLFIFHGAYKNYSPFGFLADSTEIRLEEKEFIIDDSLSLKDTLFVYQLLGFSNNPKSGLRAVKDEFSKFNRRFGKHFFIQSSEIKNGNEVFGVVQDYYINNIEGSPISVAWIKLNNMLYAFSITLRLKIVSTN